MRKAIICECGAKVSKKFCPECGKSIYITTKEIELPKKELPKKELPKKELPKKELPKKELPKEKIPKERFLKKFDDINEKSFSVLEPNDDEMLKRDQIQDKLEKLKEKMSNKLRDERKNDKQIK